MEDQLERILISQYGPDRLCITQREEIVKLVHQTVFSAFPGCAFRIAEYGSFPLRTFLKSGDIDITLITHELPLEDYSLQILSRLKQQFEYLQRIRPEIIIQDTQIINAEISIFKLKINKISADISVNQIKGLKAVSFFEEINNSIEQNLFKRSIIIVKIWACYFGRILGGMYAGMTSYALEVLVLFIINTVPASRASPLKVLQEFIRFFSEFDWERNIVTYCKVLSVSEYVAVITHKKELYGHCENLLISDEKMKKIKGKLGISNEIRLMPLKFVNIIDPCDNGNNIGRSVSQNNCERIKQVFKISYEILQEGGVEELLKAKNNKPVPQVVLGNPRMPLVLLPNNRKLSEKAESSSKLSNYDIFKGSYRKNRENFRKNFRALLSNTQKISIKA